MSGVRIKIGEEKFRVLRESSSTYVDKTGMIEDFLCDEPADVSLITRPRRFGKTLMMTTLRDFFDISQDSKAIFDGLAISKNKALCDKWMNQYPVIFLTLKEIDAQDFSHAVGQVRALVRSTAIPYSYLLESDKVNMSDKGILQEFLDSKSSRSELEAFLRTLCRALYAHWGRPAIVLIDEYDVPLARAQENGYYRDMVNFIRNILGAALKTNEYLQFGILTGCLRVSKESIFTGLNNFACYGISDFDFADKFGFTSEEVDDLLSAAGFSEKKDAIKEWYDGYRFGDDTEIYCPWDILHYLKTLKKRPAAKPKAYWQNSSGNAIIRDFISNTAFNVTSKIENLLADGYVTSSINEALTYDSLYESEENFWTLLYLSGYLTTPSPDRVKDSDASSESEDLPLVIPNREVRTIFIKNIKSWFNNSMMAMDRKPLFDAFWNGDSEGFQKILSRILLRTISYHDYHENFYHAVLTGIFVGAGWDATSNDESGLGRLDIVIKDSNNSRAAIIEVKRSSSAGEMAGDTVKALSQIKENRYVENFEGPYEKIMFWGIAFHQKFCAARAEEYSGAEFFAATTGK